MAASQKRLTALLDVDNTLIFGYGDNISYNDNLIKALLKNNISDIYLFTSMSLKNSSVTERLKLMQYLKQQGFTVHGLICASDLVWPQNKNLLKTFINEVMQTQSDDELFNILAKPQYRSLRVFANAIPGQAFADVSNQKVQLTNTEAREYQMATSAIRRYLEAFETAPYQIAIKKSEKAYLYKMFVENMPEWVGDVIFIDDADFNLEAVQAMHKKLKLDHRLFTIENRGENRIVQNSFAFYEQHLNQCLGTKNIASNIIQFNDLYSHDENPNAQTTNNQSADYGCAIL